MTKEDLRLFFAPFEVALGISLFVITTILITKILGSPRLDELYLFNLIPSLALVAAGLAIIGIWLPIFVVGIYTLGHRGAIGMSGHLVNYGIYKHVRNPMYSGVCFTIFGAGLALNNAGVIISSFIWWVIAYFECEREIKGLTKRFGKEYLEYKKKTPMFVPHFRPLIKALFKIQN